MARGRLIFKESSLAEARKSMRLLRGARLGKLYVRKTSKGYGVFEKYRR